MIGVNRLITTSIRRLAFVLDSGVVSYYAYLDSRFRIRCGRANDGCGVRLSSNNTKVEDFHESRRMERQLSRQLADHQL